MKKNLSRQTISLAFWILQAQLFNLLNAELLIDENSNYHPIPGTDCMDDFDENPRISSYAMGYPFNSSCSDNIFVCSYGDEKWGYVNTDDLKNNAHNEKSELKSLYESINMLENKCQTQDKVVWCNRPNKITGDFECLNQNNIYNTCIVNNEPQCTDMDRYFDGYVIKIWSTIRENPNYNENYLSPSFRDKVECKSR